MSAITSSFLSMKVFRKFLLDEAATDSRNGFIMKTKIKPYLELLKS